ncbi:MAG: methionyl-tRNA formyltransferase, partial [Acidipropionibacterium jensenii]|uniref:methionyl-tRNA formyltransferase n=1 Tax=Acidipropionibacterium jensenii TaxID=1749 RepID=UPI002648F878
MRILFAGTPALACPTLAVLDDHPDHEVVAVLTRPDAAQGRHRTPPPTPRAEEGARPPHPGHNARTRPEGPPPPVIEALDFDIAVVVAFGALVPEELLERPRHGWINLHFSVLPRWRGAAPVQRALMAGDATTGATVFRLVEQLDAGPVYNSRSYPIADTDTAGTLLRRLANQTPDLVTAALTDIA